MPEQEKKKRFIKPHKGGRRVRICGVHFTPDEADKVRRAIELGHSVADCAVRGAEKFLREVKHE